MQPVAISLFTSAHTLEQTSVKRSGATKIERTYSAGTKIRDHILTKYLIFVLSAEAVASHARQIWGCTIFEKPDVVIQGDCQED